MNNFTRKNLFLALLLIICILLSLVLGKANLNLFALKGFEKIIFIELRLPRTIIALITGGGLALSGAVLQGYLRNPLADSGILGIGGFASLGAIIAIFFGISQYGFWVIPILAIIFSLLAMLLLLWITKDQNGSLQLILSGVILAALAGGLVTLALSIAPNPFALSELIDWQIGSFSNVSNQDILIATPFVIIGLALLFTQKNGLDAFSLGEETAQSLGININKQRLVIIIGISLIIGATTAISGIIGFVGLIVPHLIRPFFGAKPSRILLPCFLFGASFTILADIVTRILWFNQEIKLGVIMTLIGAPFFLIILKNNKKDIL